MKSGARRAINADAARPGSRGPAMISLRLIETATMSNPASAAAEPAVATAKSDHCSASYAAFTSAVFPDRLPSWWIPDT